MSVSSSTQTGTRDIEFQLAALSAIDAAGLAQVILDESCAFCAEKAGLESKDAVLPGLKGEDESVIRNFQYALAKATARQLGDLDGNIRAVYVHECDATAEDLCFRRPGPSFLVHLVVWAERKTGALSSLAMAVDRALVEAYAGYVGASRMRHVLDIQIIDDGEVDHRLGYAALLGSLQNPPLLLWER